MIYDIEDSCSLYLVNFLWMKTTLKTKLKKVFFIPLILFFFLRQLLLFSPLSDWLQSPVMRQQGLEFFSSQRDKVKKNMKDTLNQSLIWTVSVWITAEQSGKYGRLAAVMVTDWYLKWLWNSPAAMQTDVWSSSQVNLKTALNKVFIDRFYQPELLIG